LVHRRHDVAAGLNRGLALGLFAILTFPSVVKAAECIREALLATAEKYVAAQDIRRLNITQLLHSHQLHLPGKQPNYRHPKGHHPKRHHLQGAQSGIQQKHSQHRRLRSYTELVPLTPTPHIIGTQIRHGLDAGTIALVLVDSIVATTGALFFNASATLEYFQKAASYYSSP